MAPRFRPVPADSYVTSAYGPRSGTIHRGTDFGRTGGSANMAVYAAQGGTVIHAGAASGFGGPDPAGWLVIDHPTADGSGTTVYGHIIREVDRGQRVEAGQRIGRVNPEWASNGNVAPHLHFEVHKYGWLPGSQLDPIPWLGDAPSPGETAPAVATPAAPAPDTPRTIYGVDISNWQDGILASRINAEGFRFCIIKATEGTWRDPVLHSHLADVRKNSTMHVGAYVYVRAETSPAAHADTLHAHLGDTTVPIALDIENGSGASVDHFRAIKREIEARGYRVFLTYLPRWYWDQIGQPDLSGLPPLWTSRYPDMNAGYASVIYQRAGSKGWDGYGGLEVAVWQFTSTATVAGMNIDANAFRGTERELAALFGGETSPAVDNETSPAVSPGDVKPRTDYPAHVDSPLAPVPTSNENERGQPGTVWVPGNEMEDPRPVESPAPAETGGYSGGGPRRSVWDLILDLIVSLIVGRRPR